MDYKDLGLTREQYEECINLIIDKQIHKNTDIDWQEICDRYFLPYHYDSLRKANNTIFGGCYIADYLMNKGNEINNVSDNKNDTVEVLQKKFNTETKINKDGTYSSSKLLDMSEEQSKDIDFVLKAHGFDSSSWKLVSARNNIRQISDREKGITTLYASYITVKPIDDEFSLSKIDKFFDKLNRTYTPRHFKPCGDYAIGDKLLLIDVADLHMNLQASMFTTGNEYNCDIAEDTFFHVINDILTRTSHYVFNEIVFCIGGDMLNGDNLSGSTTKGTAQDSDLHYYDAYERLCTMIIKAIDMLKAICKVNVVYVMGNHDEVTGYKLAKFVDAWFRNDDSVEVDYSPIARKYKVFGKTLFCFAHDGDVKKLPAIISDEAREYWSRIETTEVFLQHLHTEQVLMEEYNIRIQRLPTISANSRWSSNKGYNSKRQCKSFIFDKEDGLTDVLYTPIRVNKEK